MCLLLSKLDAQLKSLRVKYIMASRLCNKCKIVHPKPWDKNCKNVVGAEKKWTTITLWDKVNFRRPIKMTPMAGLDQKELYSELLASVKQLSSDMSHYNKRFNELASRVDSTDNRAKTHVTRSPESEPLFGSSQQAKGHDDRVSSASLHANDPRNKRHSKPKA